ncbi:MAG: sigma-54-dependent Fis family transcriptional regulator [Nitrospinae bacterium]|nr:sigma-54-dependent Fis family transcriptional regulator [Nitrospinota bacterium]
MSNLLIADDERSILTTLQILFSNEGHNVDTASGVAEAKKLLDRKIYDLVLTDLRLKDGDGRETLEYAKMMNSRTEVIIFTAYGSFESAVEAIKLGAFDYIIKPIDSNKLLVTVSKALEHKSLVAEVKNLRKEFRRKYGFHNILGESTQIADVLDVVQRIAETDVAVLVEGENGTGKDLIARAIHSSSLRTSGPFVAINCGGINENLLESELFGHVKGSFTGAVSNRVGLFEESDGGTLFLDEVGSMPLSLQTKLLRVLQSKTIQRLGANEIVKINTRIIAASNRKLAEMVKTGEFREDLYYRLRVVEISIPPLRERRGDVLLLCNHFLEKFASSMRRDIKGFTSEALNKLLEHPWPGNVRELENCVESAVALCKGNVIGTDDLPKSLCGVEVSLAYAAAQNPITLDELEKRYILEILKSNNYNQKKTADLLAIGRNTLWRKIKRYKIKMPAMAESAAKSG